jgi:hypothetical protein
MRVREPGSFLPWIRDGKITGRHRTTHLSSFLLCMRWSPTSNPFINIYFMLSVRILILSFYHKIHDFFFFNMPFLTRPWGGDSLLKVHPERGRRVKGGKGYGSGKGDVVPCSISKILLIEEQFSPGFMALYPLINDFRLSLSVMQEKIGYRRVNFWNK